MKQPRRNEAEEHPSDLSEEFDEYLYDKLREKKRK